MGDSRRNGRKCRSHLNCTSLQWWAILVLAALLSVLPLQEPSASPQATAASKADAPEVQARLDELDSLLARAEAARDAGDLEEARVRVAEALELLDREPRLELDDASVEVVSRLEEVSWHAGALDLSRAALTRVLEFRERTLPEDHPDLLTARNNLANSMSKMGDLAGARALQEAVLEAHERTLPEDHAELLMARSNLAVTMYRMGDLTGARALQETVLEARERTLPEDHPDLLTTRNNLALAMSKMGDLADARALQEAVLESDAGRVAVVGVMIEEGADPDPRSAHGARPTSRLTGGAALLRSSSPHHV